VVLTHGDIDHAGNCAWLRDKYGVKIAMHQADSEMVERGDMSWNRKTKPDKISVVFRIMTPLFGKPRGFVTFKPDRYLENGQTLSDYGFDAQILHLPGHSKGSIGILTSTGDLICGDLFYNIAYPGLFFFADDLTDWNASVEKLRTNNQTVYGTRQMRPEVVREIISS
jgi:glyoxylase-like metal-dependent hydrolase (beta-lactamase superfamily II)